MGDHVYANGREVSCKAAGGKSICAFPDVCFTPPQTPATPPGVPIPYPNTGMASDCTDGSSSVKISGKEVMLKNKSYFKKSTGDEAGSAPKKGIITSVNRGKVYFVVWSMDVKVEAENVVRHLDLTTHNHNPSPGQTAPFTYADRMAMAKGLKECDGDRERVKNDCGIDPDNPGKAKPSCPSNEAIKAAEKKRTAAKARAKKMKAYKGTKDGYKKSPAWKNANKGVTQAYEDFAAAIQADNCHKALKCFLATEKPSRCCKGQTPHHLVPASAIVEKGGRGKKGGENVLAKFPDYKSKKAPCICVEGPSADVATHKDAHDAWGLHLKGKPKKTAKLTYTNGPPVSTPTITYEEAVEGAKVSAEAAADHCDPACIAAQINQAHLGKPKASKADNATKLRRTMDRDDKKAGADEF
jgi:hypothetical protein